MKSILLACAMVLALISATVAEAKTKPKAPTGAVRAAQFKKATDDCNKRHSGGASQFYAEWATYYGRTGWWCVYRQ